MTKRLLAAAVAALAVTAALSINAAPLAAQEAQRPASPTPRQENLTAAPEVTKVAEGIYRVVLPYRMRTNICVAIAPDGALLVDTGFDAAAVPRLREAIRGLGAGKISCVVTSHDNWDHVAGKDIAEAGTRLVSFDSLERYVTAGVIERSTEPMKGPAGKTFDTYYALRCGGEEIRLIPFPGLHHDDDIMTYFPKAGVVHMGDLLLSESFPAVGNASEYLAFLQRVLDVFPLETQFIPGHGKLLSYRGVREYYYMLRAAEGIVAAAASGGAGTAARGGATLDEIVAAEPLEAFEPYNAFMPHLGTESWIRCVHKGIGAPDASWSVLKGPYFGQKPPGAAPEVFAPGILSTFSMIHGRIIFSPDGREAFWTNNAAPLQSRWCSKVGADGAWTKPMASLFSVEHFENAFCFTPDGKRILSNSQRPLQGGGDEQGSNIWRRAKTPSGWGTPEPLGPPINTGEWDERAPWLAGDGTLYFTRERMSGPHQSTGPGPDQNDIFCSRFVNGTYEEPVRLGPEVNSDHHEIDPVVAPDGSFLVFASNRPGGWGPRLNLYVCFRTKDGGWTPARCISGLFGIQNTWFPSLSADGKYLFFCGGMPTSQGYTDSKYYWVDTACLAPMRPRSDD